MKVGWILAGVGLVLGASLVGKVKAQGEITLITSGVTYNADSSANISRSADLVQVPVNLINPNQGWVAVRMKMGFGSTTSLTPDPIIWDMSQSNSGDLFVYYDVASDTFHFPRSAASTGGALASGSQNFATGAFKTVIAAWTGSTIKISVDGGAFTSKSNTVVPAQAAFLIGSSLVQGTGRQPNSDYYWVAAGTGTLTDANAAAIHSFGNVDHPRSDFPGSASFIWWANSNQFNNDAGVVVPTATRTPTPTGSGGVLPGDANGDCRVSIADYTILLSHFGATISGGSSVGDFDNNGRVSIADYAILVAHYGQTCTVTPTLVGPTSTRTPTPIPTRTPTPGGPTPTLPPIVTGQGIWTSAQELAIKPMSGAAWTSLKSAADASWGTANLSDQDSHHPQYTLAGALVYARTGIASYRSKTADAIMSIIGMESNPDPDCGNSPAGARSLALGRNLAAYAVAADLINLNSYNSAKDQQLRTWMSGVIRRTNCEGRTIISCHEVRPNNWGTMCGASRIAIDLYVGDKSDLDRAAKVFRGYLGDRASYAGFAFQSGAFTWMCDSSQPRPVNPTGCVKDGHDLSGAPVDDVQRGGNYTWPPNATNYAWGGFSAAVAQAEMLYRAGYPAYEWENQAIRRGMDFLQRAMASSNSAPTDWMPWVVNYHYGTSFTVKTPTGWGRLMGWTDWTHSR